MKLEEILPQIAAGVPATCLAPMQDVTTCRFMELIAGERYGAPDFFVTEFLRVHATSDFNDEIVESLTRIPARAPLFLQLIGENIDALTRVAGAALSRFGSVAGIDFNLGCPSPKICKKNVGGGLLRDIAHVAEIIPALREITADRGKLFSVKCRIGFADDSALSRIVDLANENAVDLLSVHGRTVRGLYRTPVDYGAIAFAVEKAACPVFANGEISSVVKSKFVLATTKCAGFMLGRHAIRNPWIFRQIKEARERGFYGNNAAPTNPIPTTNPILTTNLIPTTNPSSTTNPRSTTNPVATTNPAPEIFRPTLGDVFLYVRDLAECVAQPGDNPERVAARMKKFLNFVGTGVDARGEFLFEARRAKTPDEIFAVSEKFMLAGNRAEQPFPDEPFSGIVARPNCEI
ncbi:MAG: tRNA-dihydrouridine synthase family protein [Opitutae bacterium]|nr:tRNA-dihydrouridine synthase family protein [Opitutae bacterium]MCD8299203.1 tRNA-dihydrouridine synthase family protein [Opitutae bacterium]